MTIYVDDMRMRAKVGRINGIWSHLVSDSLDPQELHRFAQMCGLKREWFQHDPRFPHRDHYDVTDSIRQHALNLGATPIRYPSDLANILAAKKT